MGNPVAYAASPLQKAIKDCIDSPRRQDPNHHFANGTWRLRNDHLLAFAVNDIDVSTHSHRIIGHFMQCKAISSPKVQGHLHRFWIVTLR